MLTVELANVESPVKLGTGQHVEMPTQELAVPLTCALQWVRTPHAHPDAQMLHLAVLSSLWLQVPKLLLGS